MIFDKDLQIKYIEGKESSLITILAGEFNARKKNG